MANDRRLVTVEYAKGLIDQNYTPDSENAQSGKAVAEALSGYVVAEVGKGLSSNDFTNEDKEKLNSALQNEDIDQTYSLTSTNAQSGKAVAEAVLTEQKRADNTFANALKGSKTGTAMLIDDVSPVEHTMTVKISSDTVTDLTAIKVSRYGKNLFDKSIEYDNWKPDAGGYKYLSFYVGKNSTVTISLLKNYGTTEKDGYMYVVFGKWVDEPTSQKWMHHNTVSSYCNKYQTGVSDNGYVYVYCNPPAYTSFKDEIMIEVNSTATDYEPYNSKTDYTPNTDGTVNGVTSLYPNTTLMTDTDGVIIDCEYNRDINKAFAELQQAIISLGGNV